MSSLKVAYMLGSLNRGGAETLMLDVFRNAEKAPFQFIGIHRKGGAYRDDFYAAGPKMIQCAPKRFKYISYLLNLRRVIRTEGVTKIHAQYWLDGIYAWLATIGMRVQLVITLHGFYSMKGATGSLCRLSIHMADDVCFVSQYEQDWYLRYCRVADKKCHVIYNGVDFSKFDTTEPKGEKRWPRARLCMVGNFMSGRDHKTIFRALQLLNERGVNGFEFYFIGRRSDAEPQIYDECEKIVKMNNLSHVHFLGARSDVPSQLKSMDGFVYCTNRDSFGIAVVEALAVGLPVVVNDWPVMKEICGAAVVYFKSKDVVDCANAIERMLTELPQRKAAAQKYVALVRERYSIAAYIQRLNEIYSLVYNR